MHGVVDQALDLLCRPGRTLCQRAHLGGDHGKTATLFAGTRRFHRCIQRQDIGLERDAIDDADDVGDLLGRGFDAGHGGDHLRHHFTALRGHAGGADGKLVGLTGAFGILLDGGGELLHRGGGFFQIGGLLLGTVRQVAIARGDFAGGRIDRGGRHLDAPDDVGQLLGGGIGIVAHLREHAAELTMHAHGQVTTRQRGQQGRDLFQAAGIGIQQTVELLRQLQEETLLAVGFHTPAHVAAGGRAHDAGHFFFHLHFDGAVAPFADFAAGLALFVLDRGDGLRQHHFAETLFEAGDAIAFQRGNGLAHGRIRQTQVADVLADDLARVELGRCQADAAFVLRHDLLEGIVGVDHHAFGIGDEGAGRGLVQRGADAQVFVGNLLVAFDAFLQVALHALHGAHQLAHFVLALHVDLAVQLAAGNFGGRGDRAAHALDDGTGEQEGQAQAAGDADQQHHQGQRDGSGVDLFGLGLGRLREQVVFGNQGGQRILGLVVQGTGFADEGVDGVVGQIQLHHFVDAGIGGRRLLPVRHEHVEQLLLLRAFDQARVALDGGFDLAIELLGADLGLLLDRIAGAHQVLVGRIPVFAEHAAQIACLAHAGHGVAGQVAGDVIERRQTRIGDDALDEHDQQHDAERQHQLGHQFQIVDPLH